MPLSETTSRVRYGVRDGASAWVTAPEGDYTITIPAHLAKHGGYVADDLIISERPAESKLSDDELRWMAMDAFCDAYGVQ